MLLRHKPAIVNTTPPATHTLTATPTTRPGGGDFTANWTAPVGSSTKDWIIFVLKSAPSSSYLQWVYTGGATTGSFTVSPYSTPGEYEFRYLINDGYTSAVTSNTVTIT